MSGSCKNCLNFMPELKKCRAAISITVNCPYYTETRKCGNCKKFTDTDYVLGKGNCLNRIGDRRMLDAACDEYIEKTEPKLKSVPTERVESRFELMILENE